MKNYPIIFFLIVLTHIISNKKYIRLLTTIEIILRVFSKGSMTKEIHKYPYNATTEDEIKVFLSNQICEQVVRITYRNGRILCTIKDRITSNKKEVTLSAAIIFGALFGMPTEARSIGVPPRLSSAPEINRAAPQHFHQHAPTVNPRVDKIIMITNNKMIPLIYINGHYSYINEQLLKKLRAGNLASNQSSNEITPTSSFESDVLGVTPVGDSSAPDWQI